MDYRKSKEETSRILTPGGGFTGIGQKRFYSSKNFNLKTYIKWQRSKSVIGDAMDPIMPEEFLEKIEKAMKRFFPDGSIWEDFKYDLIYGRRKL